MTILIKKVLDFVFIQGSRKTFYQHTTQWFLGIQPLPGFQDQALIDLISGNLETEKTGFLPKYESSRFCCLDQTD